MKVLFTIDGLGTGGAERSLAEMLPGLIDGGINPTVVCLHRRPQGVEPEVIAAGFDVRFLDATRTLAQILELRRLLIAEAPDIVHTAIFQASLVGRLAAARLPTIVLSSLVNTPYTPVRLQDPHIRGSSLRAVRAADTWTAHHLTTHFHAITNAVKAWAVIAMRIPLDRITVVERGRDPKRLGRPDPSRRHEVRSALGFTDHHEVLVAVGRQEFQKGHRYLLEAMAELAPRHARLALMLAGREGEMSGDLSRLRRRLGLEERILFLGHRRDLPDLLAAADLFVFPSLYEGLGGSVIEAMAMNLPIVASDLPALREVLGGAGVASLVPPGSPSGLARAIAELLDDKAKGVSMAARGRAVFEERFTVERSTEGMIQLYRRLAQDRDGRGPARFPPRSWGRTPIQVRS